MKDEKNVPHDSYSLDEILVEAKLQSGREGQDAPEESGRAAALGRRAPLTADDIVRDARRALNMESGEKSPVPEAEKPKKKKHSFFHRKKEKEAAGEDDVFYGLQLKSIEEYRREYEKTISFDKQQIRDAEEQLRRKQEARQGGLSTESTELPKPEQTPEPEKQPEEEKTVPQAETPEEAAPEPPEPEAKPAVVPEKKPWEAANPEATPQNDEFSSSRQNRLERIMRHAGLGAGDMFGEEPGTPEPEYPGNPPLSPEPPAVQPPVPPTVQPGPEMEPEIKPPITEPPLTPGLVPETEAAPERAEALSGSLSAESESEKEKPAEPVPEETKPIPETELTGPTPETEETEPAQASRDEPTAVKEPVAPPTAKEVTHVPPAEKEPPRRPVPRYRAVSEPIHIIELNVFNDVLAEEAADYSAPPIHAPEPIPFPASTEKQAERTHEPETGEKERQPIRLQEKEVQENAGDAQAFQAAAEAGEPEKPKEKKKKRFRVFGSDEDPTAPDDVPNETEDELDDYNVPADAPSIRNDLAANVRKMSLRSVVTGIFAAILVASAVVWEHPAFLPRELHSLCGAQTCLTIQLIFLLLAGAFCAPALWNGLRGLFSLQANSDSGVSVAVLAACAENITFLCTGVPADCRLYSALAALALFLNSAGKLSMSRRILRNFRFLSSPDQKYAVRMFDDYNTALQLAKGCVVGEPKIACQAKVGFLEHFLRHSYGTDPNEHVSQFLAPIGFIGSLALCITAAVLTRDPSAALTAFTASACVCVPFGGLLSVSLPLSRLQKISDRCGGMTVGWDAVEQFSDTNAVMLDAEDLFPRGTVVLNGIQTFVGQRIDEAILDATALTKAVGGPLSGLFSQIVKTRGEILPQVERPVYEDGLGVSGMVSDRVILIGNGELLKRHGVDAPSHDYEEKYLRAGKIPVYLAAGGVLVAMFLVFYRSDRRRAVELRRLERNGISLLVRTRDPNITPELVSQCFGLSRHSIAVLPERLGNVYASLRAHPPERAPAMLATKGRAAAMIRILTGCVRQRSNIIIGTAIQTAGAALGFSLVAFFTACSGLGKLTVTALLLFEAFWAAVAVLVPHIRKP